MSKTLPLAILALTSGFMVLLAYVLADNITGKTVITQGTIARKQFNPEWTAAATEMPIDDKGNTMYIPGAHYDACWSLQLKTAYGDTELTVDEEAGKLLGDGQTIMLRVRIGGYSHGITSVEEYREGQ